MVKSFTRKPLSDSDLAKPWLRENDTGIWLSYTSHALRVIAQLRIACEPVGTTPCVWVPDYFCNSALSGLRETQSRLVFYPVTTGLEPDYAKCRQMAALDKPDIFVLVHYFGSPANAKDAAEFCKRNGAWFVEDAAHVYLPVRGVGEKGDFVLYSPHKHLPLPDGALLVLRPSLFSGANPSREEVLVKLSKLLKFQGNAARYAAWYWLGKRLVQKFGLRRRAPSVDFASDLPSRREFSGATMSWLAESILSAILHDLEWIRHLRHRNGEVWDDLFHEEAHRGGATEPAYRYVASYKFTSQELAQDFHDRLHAIGAPVTAWPDLPPEVYEGTSMDVAARQMRTTHVHLHLHQDLSLILIASSAKSRLLNCASSQISFDWYSGTDADWSKLYLRTVRPNLVQSWDYAQAKAEIDGVSAKRGVFAIDGQPIAIMVALRRLPGIWRLNRGPLLLREVTPTEQVELLRVIGRVFSGRLLAIAPDLEAGGRHWLALAEFGFRPRKCLPWTTVWLDLTQSAEALRGGLSGKWRNALSFAERAGLEFLAEQGDDGFAWMVARHQEAMQTKGYSSTPVAMLHALRAEAALFVFRASLGGVAVGGIGVARHGTGATYLVGWNGGEGRNVKANQFLLWQAVIWLRARGVKQFDLGGIDESQQPGIAEFKLGMGGRRVELAGEFVRF